MSKNQNNSINKSDNKKSDGNAQKYSLNDDRRVKVLSPSMMVTKRFLRNRIAVTGLIILIFMFVFSFLGGVFSPYKQDQFFYKETEIKREFGAVKENNAFRYESNDKEAFSSAVQAQTMLNIQKKQEEFTYRDKNYVLKEECKDFYSVYSGGKLVGIAFKDIISSSTKDVELSFDFIYNALECYLGEGGSFVIDGEKYTVDKDGTVMQDNEEYAYISRYIVQAVMPDIFLSHDFKEKLIETVQSAENGSAKFVYTDESLIVKSEEDNNENKENKENKNSEDIQKDEAVMATAEYDIVFKPDTNSWSILQMQKSHQYDTYSSPNKEHWLGTDKYGMDMLTRLMYGGRVSLVIGFIVVFIETFIGVIFGGISGYFGGNVDNIIMRIVDVFYCIPSLPIIIIIGAAMDAQRVDPTIRMVYLMLTLGFLGWAGIARLVRGQILSLREQEFMTATEACGIKVSRRIFKHLIPNVIPQLIVNCTMGLGSVIITEATLSFLGLGVKFPFASWGNIINDVNNTYVLTTYWFIWIPAGILLLLTVLAFNLVGDGLRDAFDPKMKR